MNQKTSKSSLFLMELIIAILFFSLAGGICIQLFVNSHLVSKNSINLNHAVMWSQNLSESFYACEDLKAVASLYEDADLNLDNDTLYLFFDKDWNPVSHDKMETLAGSYTTTYIASMTCSTQSASTATAMTTASIQVDMLSSSLQDYIENPQNATSIYTLSVEKYTPVTLEVTENE